MSNDGLAKLTVKEREALRLVHRRLTSKEIAPLLGVRVDAIDARIKSATRKLGIPDRGKAALFLAENEAEGTYQQRVYQSPEIAGQGTEAMLGGPVAGTLKEEFTSFQVDRALAVGTSVPAKTEEHGRVKLNSWQRLGIIAAVAIGTIIAFGLLVSTLNGLVQLVTAEGRLF